MDVKLLASVANVEEAELACALGADLIDLKDPHRGALGAWPVAKLREAGRVMGGRRPLSATVGDLPMAPNLLLDAVRATADTGVDIVKVGFFASPARCDCALALSAAAVEGIRLVAVLMADQALDPALLPVLHAAGFYGAMLDTATKDGGSLRRRLDPPALADFVATAKELGLLTGLAGSLGVCDIAPLAALRPDYLGFRGALCRGDRTGRLDPEAFAAVRRALNQACGGLAD